MAKRKRIVPDTGKPRCVNCRKLDGGGICRRVIMDAWYYVPGRTPFNVGEKITNPQNYHCASWSTVRAPGMVDDIIGYDGEAA